MKDLSFDLKRICQKDRDGSFGTIAARQRSLILIGDQLEKLGYRHMKSAEQLKPKHIYALVQHWQETGITSATIKNRLAHLRWLAAKIQHTNLVSPSNDQYGVERRRYVDNIDKSVRFESDQLNLIRDPHIRLSALLQRSFGLRREEALKITPTKADQITHIQLQGSWTKGGKPRRVPIRTEQQRRVLDQAKRLALNGSMIPSNRKYVQHLRLFEKEMHRVGLGKTHGARHFYAQTRYKELSGQDAPVRGGRSRKTMSRTAREQDNAIRLQISRELGHERMQIVAIYIGS